MDSESAEIPIIAVTANAFKSDEEHCAEAGMNAHLSKPFDINHKVIFDYLFKSSYMPV